MRVGGEEEANDIEEEEDEEEEEADEETVDILQSFLTFLFSFTVQQKKLALVFKFLFFTSKPTLMFFCQQNQKKSRIRNTI
jgi:hypothetical protein